MSPNYSLHGKLRRRLPLEEFSEKAKQIKNKKHLAFSALLFYTGVRVTELTRVSKEQFATQGDLLLFDVGPREKTGHKTDPLEIPVSMPFMDTVMHLIKYTKKGAKVFGFSRQTGYRIIARYFNAYPHYFRLNCITQFLMEGYTLPEVMSWSGHISIEGVNPYIGLASVRRLGAGLAKRAEEMGVIRR